MEIVVTEKKPRGFAAMSPERRRELASQGGAAVPAAKRTFARDRSKAVLAGAAGGAAVPAAKRTFSRDQAAAVEAGRKGGLARAEAVRLKGVGN